MRTRDEAVEFLRARGLHAEKRDWALGETIVAATGGSEADGIVVYRRAMYIVPRENRWSSFELDHPRPEDDLEVPLEQACARVIQVLESAGSP